MKIATYNVNGVNGRLPVLLRWLKEAQPDIVCLQELKAPQEKFPVADIRGAGYGAIWNGQKSWNGVAILARGSDPVETRRGLPGGPDDLHSRYIEAAVSGLIVGCLYLPNGNPAPGPKFDYKLEWFDRLTKYAKKLLASGAPVILAGDYNVMPTDLDVYKPERWLDDALFRPEVKSAYAKLLKQGWTDALRQLHPKERIYTFWDYFRNAYARDAGLRIDHFLLSAAVARRLKEAHVDREVRGWPKTSDHAPVWIELKDAKKSNAEKAVMPMCNEYAREAEMAKIIAYMEEMKDTPPFEYTQGHIPNDIAPKKGIRIRDTSIVIGLKDKKLQGAAMPWAWKGAHGKPVFNFKSEGCDFSKSGRVLIPATGFYEYTAPADKKVKLKDQHLFTLSNEEWFWVAGIVKDNCFAMLTTEPGPDIKPYHDRQICLLHPKAGMDWLRLTRPEKDLLKAPPKGSLAVRTLRENGKSVA